MAELPVEYMLILINICGLIGISKNTNLSVYRLQC